MNFSGTAGNPIAAYCASRSRGNVAYALVRAASRLLATFFRAVICLRERGEPDADARHGAAEPDLLSMALGGRPVRLVLEALTESVVCR